MDPFRRYSRSKSKVVRHRAEFFDLPIFLGWGAAFQKLYPVYHPCLVARRLKNFHENTLTSSKVIDPNMLNFRPNFNFSRLKFFWGTLVPVGGVRYQALVNL